MQDILNIFVIETELQYLALHSINNQIDQLDESIVFTTSSRVYDRLRSDCFDSYLITRSSSGWLGRLIRIRKNLRLYRAIIKSSNKEYSEINFHVPRIDNVHNNLAINYLRYHFSVSKINVRLIPDGAINIFSCLLSPEKREKQNRWLKNSGFRLFPDLKFMQYDGDELGANADIVDKIYSFEGVETSYPKHKLCNIRLPLAANKEPNGASAALVIGQNFLQLKTASQEFIDQVSEKIQAILEEASVGRIDYAPHPRSEFNEFFQPGYNVLGDDYLCVEECIAAGGYSHVISCYSSALINSKIMLGDEIEAISVGLDSFPFPDSTQSLRLIDCYKKLGINVIS